MYGNFISWNHVARISKLYYTAFPLLKKFCLTFVGFLWVCGFFLSWNKNPLVGLWVYGVKSENSKFRQKPTSDIPPVYTAKMQKNSHFLGQKKSISFWKADFLTFLTQNGPFLPINRVFWPKNREKSPFETIAVLQVSPLTCANRWLSKNLVFLLTAIY